MELRHYLSILRRRVWLIIAAVTVAVAFTVATNESVPVYTAEATIYVGANTFNLDTPDSNLSGDRVAGLTQIINTFAVMIDSIPVAEDAIARTGLPHSPESVEAQTVAFALKNTNLLKVQVSDPDPSAAQALATGIAEAFVDQITDLESGQTLAEGELPQAPASIFQRASLPTVPSTDSLTASLVLAVLLALVGSCGLILLGEYLDVTVRTAQEAEHRFQLPVLGVIPELSLPAEQVVAHRRAVPTVERELVPRG